MAIELILVTKIIIHIVHFYLGLVASRWNLLQESF